MHPDRTGVSISQSTIRIWDSHLNQASFGAHCDLVWAVFFVSPNLGQPENKVKIKDLYGFCNKPYWLVLSRTLWSQLKCTVLFEKLIIRTSSLEIQKLGWSRTTAFLYTPCTYLEEAEAELKAADPPHFLLFLNIYLIYRMSYFHCPLAYTTNNSRSGRLMGHFVIYIMYFIYKYGQITKKIRLNKVKFV